MAECEEMSWDSSYDNVLLGETEISSEKQKQCLRALIQKFRLEACKMKKSKILKVCQNKGLGKVFLEK